MSGLLWEGCAAERRWQRRPLAQQQLYSLLGNGTYYQRWYITHQRCHKQAKLPRVRKFQGASRPPRPATRVCAAYGLAYGPSTAVVHRLMHTSFVAQCQQSGAAIRVRGREFVRRELGSKGHRRFGKIG